VIAAFVGIACNSPARYLQVDPMSLGGLVSAGAWGQPGVDAKRELTLARLAELGDARARNQSKGRLVMIAMALQLCAVGLTAMAVVHILSDA
jgi:hypothetical protein